jgi:hypothetical protein
MFGKCLAILLCLIPLIAWAQARPAFGPPGYQLPDRVSPENLDELLQAMVDDNCNTPGCTALRVAIVQILTNTSQRKNPGTIWQGRPVPDIPYGAIKAREIDNLLRPFKAIWPEICRAVVEIGARDDFVHGLETYGWLAASVLDVARHLTRPGLDCLGEALAAMPESKYLQASMGGLGITVWTNGAGRRAAHGSNPLTRTSFPHPPCIRRIEATMFDLRCGRESPDPAHSPYLGDPTRRAVARILMQVTSRDSGTSRKAPHEDAADDAHAFAHTAVQIRSTSASVRYGWIGSARIRVAISSDTGNTEPSCARA